MPPAPTCSIRVCWAETAPILATNTPPLAPVWRWIHPEYFYLVGTTGSNQLPVTPGAFQTTYYGNPNPGFGTSSRGFVAKFNPVSSGASLVYATYLGGFDKTVVSYQDVISGIAADAAGNAYVSGNASYDFPATPGANNSTPCPSANSCDESRFSGQAQSRRKRAGLGHFCRDRITDPTLSAADTISPPRLDASGNVYVSGIAGNNTEYPLLNPLQPANGFVGVYVTMYDPTGSTMFFSTVIYNPGANVEVFNSGVDVDSQGNIYVAGYTPATGLPVTAGVFQAANAGGFDGFIVKINPLLSSQSVTFSPIASQTAGTQLALDAVASSGLSITYTSSTTNVCTVSGNTVSLIGVGTCTVTASQPGNTAYGAASPVSESFFVAGMGSLQFIPVTPCRVADTRNPAGAFGGPQIAKASSRSFPIPQSSCGIPATAAAYSFNVTAVPRAALGYLSVWPTGQPQPLVSTLNSSDGRVKADAVIVDAGANGAISVYVSDASDVVLDINGYFAPVGSAPSALVFYPATPCRVADTRNPKGLFGGPFMSAGQIRSFTIPSSTCNIPASGAYSLNFTVIPHGRFGYLSTWPTGQQQPFVSTLNAFTGQVTANAAIVPAGTNGAVSVYVTHDTDLVIDINGYFGPQSGAGLSLYSLSPCRVLDTRNVGNKQPFVDNLAINVIGSSCSVPGTAQAIVTNATVVPVNDLGYLSLWPDGQAKPLVSTLNSGDGSITSNLAIIPMFNGSVDAYASNSTSLILDVSGYFAP